MKFIKTSIVLVDWNWYRLLGLYWVKSLVYIDILRFFLKSRLPERLSLKDEIY